jgi:hypothetical protein
MLGFRNREWAVLTTDEKIDYEMRYSFKVNFNFYLIFILLFIHVITILSIGILFSNEIFTTERIDALFTASMDFINTMWIITLVFVFYEVFLIGYNIGRFIKWKKSLKLEKRNIETTSGIINNIISGIILPSKNRNVKKQKGNE